MSIHINGQNGQMVEKILYKDTNSNIKNIGSLVHKTQNVYNSFRQIKSPITKVWGNRQFYGARDLAVNSYGEVFVAYYVPAEELSATRPSLVKFNSDGTVAWERHDIDLACSVAVDAAGDVYVAYNKFSSTSAEATTSIRKISRNNTTVWSVNSYNFKSPNTLFVYGSFLYVGHYPGNSGYKSLSKLYLSNGNEYAHAFNGAGEVRGIVIDDYNNIYFVQEYDVGSLVKLTDMCAVQKKVSVPTLNDAFTGLLIHNNSLYVFQKKLLYKYDLNLNLINTFDPGNYASFGNMKGKSKTIANNILYTAGRPNYSENPIHAYDLSGDTPKSRWFSAEEYSKYCTALYSDGTYLYAAVEDQISPSGMRDNVTKYKLLF